MRRFKKILLRWDGNRSKAALDRAVSLAKDNQALLTLVSVPLHWLVWSEVNFISSMHGPWWVKTF